jgi:hypothetical protein
MKELMACVNGMNMLMAINAIPPDLLSGLVIE